MNNLKAFNLSFGAVLIRFYLMMALVITAGFSGYWLVGLLALPVFLSIMLGVAFSSEQKNKTTTVTLKSTSRGQYKEVA